MTSDHRKEVDFESGKVLVSRLGDKLHATSAFCTHYGAPLAKGVLTSDGRVVWCVKCLPSAYMHPDAWLAVLGTEVRLLHHFTAAIA